MADIRILNETELRQLVALDGDVLVCIEDAFRRLATEAVVMPPVLSFPVPAHNGEVDIKTAYVPGLPSFAVKMSPGFFDNPRLGLPSLNGLMVVFSARTGLVEGLLLDNGWLTDVRTAAAGALAAKWLARDDSHVAGIIGAGVQARLQLRALSMVRPIDRALIWGRDPEKARACAADCANQLGIDVTAAPSIDQIMAHSDIIVTTTPAREPLITAAQLRPGQHITAMGSDADYKCELAPDVIATADRYVCDRFAQCLERGELRAAIAAGAVNETLKHGELGSIIAGTQPGRITTDQITLCDLTGTGIQDTAIAALATERAARHNAGIIVNSG